MTDEAIRAGLAPVRAAMLAAARRDGDETRARSGAAAAAALAAAMMQAERIRTEASQRGAADAQAGLGADRARARRQAHAEVLAARREAYEALRSAGRAAVVALRDEPGYPLLRDQLANAARRLLGPDATVRDAPGGGVVAAAAGRRVDLSLAELADRAVTTIAAQDEDER